MPTGNQEKFIKYIGNSNVDCQPDLTLGDPCSLLLRVVHQPAPYTLHFYGK